MKLPLHGLLAFVFLSATGITTLAQEAAQHSATHYIDSDNRYYQQADLPVYLYIAHSPDAKPNQLASAEGEQTKGEMEPIYLDGHGVHYIRHADNLDNTLQTFAIHADGRKPKTSFAYGAAERHSQKGTNYFGKGHAVSLTATDQMSGLKELYFALNGTSWQPYAQELSFDKEGSYQLRYYSVDRVGNAEEPGQLDFVVDLTAPSTYHNVVGLAKNNVISTNTQIYLTPADSVSGVATTYYQFDGGDYKTYRKGNIPFAQLADGDHVLHYYSVDQVGNKEAEQNFSFYLDKTAPIMSSDVLGDRFIVNDKVYFSGRTKLKLTAVDNKSGIKEVRYSVDGADYEDYNDPFYLPSVAGEHTIRYYALDNLDNQGAGDESARIAEYRHNVAKVYVDLTGPTLSHRFTGPMFNKGDSVYISSESRLVLSATDPESGLQYISYTLDQQGEEKVYEEPFGITGKGFHRIDIFGYDNVNNRNIDNFYIMVDDESPQIQSTFSVAPVGEEDGLQIYPSYVTLFIASTDQQSGYDRIRYAVGAGTPKTYGQPISGFKKDTVVELTVWATDKLGNERQETIRFKTAAY